jgi:L-ascorbate metabolism protein UlaG (beta-lactamase superfamily)
MEITWFGQGCVRLKGREGTIVADPYPSIVGPTGRGLVADVITFSHRDPHPLPQRGESRPSRCAAGTAVIPTSLEPAFCLDGPGEFEIHDVLVHGVRTGRDEASDAETRGAEGGFNTAFVYQLDGLHVVHLGDLGHLLSEEQLKEIGAVDVVCLPLGGRLSVGRAAEVVAQVDARLVVPVPVGETEEASQGALSRFLQEMGAKEPVPQARLVVTISSVPEELTVVLLDQRGRA